MKKFSEWSVLKENLDITSHKAPFVSEGDIWWACIGENVGSEIAGKSKQFSRPVIIFKKLAHGFYFVIPTTTKVKEGSWYVQFTHAGIITTACLHQARAIDYRRLSSKLGTLDQSDINVVQSAFRRLYIK
jgi:mRNA interferase MazF